MKRPIDKLRDSAGSFDLHTPDDDSEIADMLSAADRLVIVKGKGVYEVRMADQIDPDRTNINVPNTIQRVMSVGAETPWVTTILLTADGFFGNKELVKGIDCARAFTLVFEIAQHLARMHEVRDEYLKAQTTAASKFDPKIRNRSVILPTVDNAQAMCKEFLQKSDHVLRELLSLVKLFHGEAAGAWEGLQAKIKAEPAVDNFGDWLDSNVPFLLTVRNARNAAEHPNERMRMEVQNFCVDKNSNVRRPSLKVTHPKTPIEHITIEQLLVEVCERMVLSVELLMVFLCARHIRKADGGFPLYVSEVPEGKRRRAEVRYAIGMDINGEFEPMS